MTRATVGTGSDGKLALFDWMTSTPMVKSVAADGTVAELGLGAAAAIETA